MAGQKRFTVDSVRLPEQAQQVNSIPTPISAKNGGTWLDLGIASRLKYHTKCDGFKNVCGRIIWDNVVPTITTGFVNPSVARFLHPARNREVSLREETLLHSFPSSYCFSLGRGQFSAAQLVGNGLTPEFIRRHAMQVARFLGEATEGKQAVSARKGRKGIIV